jgi:hypothetical protein
MYHFCEIYAKIYCHSFHWKNNAYLERLYFSYNENFTKVINGISPRVLKTLAKII